MELERHRNITAKGQRSSPIDDDAETDDDNDDDDDYGPTPAAGIWAGSQKLQHESERMADCDGEGEEETDEDGDEVENPATKKARIDTSSNA